MILAGLGAEDSAFPDSTWLVRQVIRSGSASTVRWTYPSIRRGTREKVTGEMTFVEILSEAQWREEKRPGREWSLPGRVCLRRLWVFQAQAFRPAGAVPEPRSPQWRIRGCFIVTRLAVNFLVTGSTLAWMLTLSYSSSEAQSIRFDFLYLNHSTHLVASVILTVSTSPRYWMKALLVILIATTNLPVFVYSSTESTKMVAVMEILVGVFIATSMVRLDPAASTGVAMSIAANTTITTIVSFLFKSHRPFRQLLFPFAHAQLVPKAPPFSREHMGNSRG